MRPAMHQSSSVPFNLNHLRGASLSAVLLGICATWSYAAILDVEPGEANLREAQAKVRSMVASMDSDLHVRLHGRYDLTRPFVLDESDAGRNGFRVHWESAPGNIATISGATGRNDWTQDGDLWKMQLDVHSLRQLFVNGQRRIRARTPNRSDTIDNGPYFRLVDWDLDKSSILVRASDVPNGASDSGVELVVQKHWNLGILRVAHVNDSSGGTTRVLLKHPDVEFNAFTYPQKDPDQPFRWENSKRFLDAPGEWFFDKTDRTLYYRPEAGEAPGSTIAWIPTLETIVEFRKTKAITLKNLVIEYSAWDRIDTTGYGDDQGSIWVAGASHSTPVDSSWWPSLLIRGALEIDSSEGIRIQRCAIRHIGGQGILFQGNTRGNRIVGNRVEDVAANGIAFRQRYLQRFGGSKSDTVDHNEITKIGQVFTGTVAVNAMYPESLRIEHNRIMEIPYSGISLGWDWDGFSTPAKGNRIRFNEIFRTNRLHDDGGGIYTLGWQPGSIVSGNWIHEIVRGPWLGAWPLGALYFDQASKDFESSSNSFLGMDPSGARIDVTYLGAGVTTSDVQDSGNSSSPSALKMVRALSGPLPEIFWTRPTSDSDALSIIPDALNLVFSKTATSTFPEGLPASHGTDGDPATFVKLPPGYDGWWQVDLGNTYVLSRIALLGTDTASHPFKAGPSCSIEASISSDFANPFRLGVWTANKQGISSDWWIGPDRNPPIRFVRIVNTSADTFSFSELQLTGVPQSYSDIAQKKPKPSESRIRVFFDPRSGSMRIWRGDIGRVSPIGKRN